MRKRIPFFLALILITSTIMSCVNLEEDEPAPQVPLIKINSLPVATNDLISTIVNKDTILKVLSNDYDPDGYVDFKIKSVTYYGDAEISSKYGEKEIYYRPKSNYVGKDTIYYKIADDSGAVASAMVLIDISYSSAQNTTINILMPFINKALYENNGSEYRKLNHDYTVESTISGSMGNFTNWKILPNGTLYLFSQTATGGSSWNPIVNSYSNGSKQGISLFAGVTTYYYLEQ